MCSYRTARYRYLDIALALFLLYSVNAAAGEKVPEFITFTLENDLFVGEDDGYTNGFGVTYGKGHSISSTMIICPIGCIGYPKTFMSVP
jgi:hypothetical protein